MYVCKSRFRLLALIGLFTLTLLLAVDTPAAYGNGGDNQLSIPEKTELKYPNLGSSLDQMAATVEEGELSARDAAKDAPVSKEESVAVTIYLSGNVDEVVTFLEDNGGDPRNIGEDYIEAYVPVTLVGQLSEQPGVHPGPRNHSAAADPDCPAHFRTWASGPWFGGLEPGRVQRAGHQGGNNRPWL